MPLGPRQAPSRLFLQRRKLTRVKALPQACKDPHWHCFVTLGTVKAPCFRAGGQAIGIFENRSLFPGQGTSDFLEH